MLDKVTDVAQADKCLLHHDMVAFDAGLSLPSIAIRCVVSLKLKLLDRFPDHLLHCGEKTEVKKFLRVLWAIDEMSLNEEVSQGIHCHEVDLML